MTRSARDRPTNTPPPAGGEEGFVRRWSRRKRAAQDSQSGAETAAAAPAVAPPAKVLADADMPPLESLDEHSDYSPFLSPGVSEDLRQRALRRLFMLPSVNQRDLLDGEYHDCRGYEPLGDVITHEMREEMEREAQQQTAQRAGNATEEPPRQTPRHSRHLRKRTARKRSHA
jgi:hypothetical protein